MICSVFHELSAVLIPGNAVSVSLSYENLNYIRKVGAMIGGQRLMHSSACNYVNVFGK
jgi:hypothetical protein